MPAGLSLFSSPQWHEIGMMYCERRKTPHLALDLIALGVAPDALAALPRCRELPDVVGSGPHLFGCLYVIEGETRRGQFITRHLHTKLGMRSPPGCSRNHTPPGPWHEPGRGAPLPSR